VVFALFTSQTSSVVQAGLQVFEHRLELLVNTERLILPNVDQSLNLLHVARGAVVNGSHAALERPKVSPSGRSAFNPCIAIVVLLALSHDRQPAQWHQKVNIVHAAFLHQAYPSSDGVADRHRV
jgi:hypothetical protein